ncbi:TRAP transporter permease [Mesobacillus harenae]|uniref:TRAP transporter permease n=1 Tax=Mesobacillus harenae TaxID=2213203 RepID=UPI00157FCDCF|nr:TRAP transporter permease [Mesobacillus harenae]
MAFSLRDIGKYLIIIIAVVLTVFHLYTAAFGVLPGLVQRSIHWMLISIIIFLIGLTSVERKKTLWEIIGNITLLVFATVTGLYIFLNYDEIIQNYGLFSSTDVILGILAIIVLLEASRRVLGMILPIVTLVFIFYAFAGPWLPGLLGHNGVSFERFFTFMYLGSDGIYGMALGVSATFIFLFILFGSFLNRSGAGQFFVDLALAGTGRITGGPAMSAVASSAMMGTISGSGVANVVTTGAFTIPLMKKTGYKPHFAGAVEAVASNGGQIAPPIMGAVAFLMAELLGIPYLEIATAAIIPAALYFIAVGFVVYAQAKKDGIRPLTKEEVPNLRKTIKSGIIYFVPLIIIVLMLIQGFSPMRAAFFAILSVIVIGVLKKDVQFNLKAMLESIEEAAKSALPVAAACACAGIVIGVVSLTGLGLKLSSLIVSLSGGIVIIALIITMLVSIVLGMGLPTSAAYLLLAVLGGPALIEMGVNQLSAHLFILYFGCLSTITPPVALSSFAAAGIAGSSPMQTGFTSFRLAIVAFIIPYMFVFNPSLLMNGEWSNILIATVSAAFGCYLMSGSIIGWLLGNVGFSLRIVLFIAAVLMLYPGIYSDLIGFAVFVSIFLWRKYIPNSSKDVNLNAS